MMGTIYKLNFKSGDIYIGKTSLNLNIRINSHVCNKGKGSPLLEYAFANTEYTGYDVLEEDIPDDLLDATEKFYIARLSPSLNTLPGGEGMRGLNHPRSKYSREQLEEVAELLINTAKTYQEIVSITNVKLSTVRDIAFLRTHSWLIEKYGRENLEEAQKARSFHYVLYDEFNNKCEAYTGVEFKSLYGINPHYIIKGTAGVSKCGKWSMIPHDIHTISHREHGKLTGSRYYIKTVLQEKYKLSKQNVSAIFNTLAGMKGWKREKK